MGHPVLPIASNNVRELYFLIQIVFIIVLNLTTFEGGKKVFLKFKHGAKTFANGFK